MDTYARLDIDGVGTVGHDLAVTLNVGDIVTLAGPVGAGKSVFVRAAAGALKVTDEMASPTFVLAVEHEGVLPVLHVDLYRLSVGSFDELGLEETMEQSVTFIEWPERAPHLVEAADVAVTIVPIDGDFRRVEVVDRRNGRP